MRRWALLALAAASLAFWAGAARALDEGKLKNLQAPPAAAQPVLPHDIRNVKFSRFIVQLKPEPWAFLRNKASLADDKLISWQDGQKAINPTAYAAIFEEELKKASGGAEGQTGLFAQAAGQPDYLVAVKINDMQGRFCKACNLIG